MARRRFLVRNLKAIWALLYARTEREPVGAMVFAEPGVVFFGGLGVVL